MKEFFLTFSGICILIIISFFVFYKVNLNPVSPNRQLQTFVVNQGDGVVSISTRLEKNKLIKNKYVFITYSYIYGLNSQLKAGGFRLSPSFSTPEIIKKLSEGGSQDFWLKIKEGSRIEEIATLFPKESDIDPKIFIQKTKDKEGYIFPDSYLIPQDYDVDQVLNIINKNFSQKLAEAKNNITLSEFTDKQTIILASLLEREGKSLKSKQDIAGILINRLKIGMPLQLDATVQYAQDSQLPHPTEYWQSISKSDLSINSPFNTYKNQGLPPSPICNPGFNSLYAAYHPIDSDYLFYITGNDGNMHYARTLEEHNRNIQKYLK